MAKVPERAIKVHYEFDQVFEENLRGSKSYPDAYEKAEKEHEDFFGRRRYAGYESFKQIKSRKRRK